MVDYCYQIWARKGTTEYALMVMFDSSLHAVYPLHDELLDSPFAVSFIYGDRDWTLVLDGETAEDIVNRNPNYGCGLYYLGNSDHNM